MSTKEMTAEEVKKIADLIKVSLNDAEIKRFQTVIPQTLDTIAVLNELDTTTTPPTSQVNGLQDVFRTPEVAPSLSQEEALLNAKEQERGLFVTKAVFNR